MKFTKQILRPGTYVVRSPDGGRSEVKITPDRLRRYSDTFYKMRANGLKVPAPWRHDKSEPMAKEVKDARDYGGYWEEAWIGSDGALYGKLDAPLAADSDKIGETVTEVSPYIQPEWVDGKGNKYEDAMLHIALVQHPVAPDQPNFLREPAGDDGAAVTSQPAMALSLSLLVEGAVEFADEVANSNGAGAGEGASASKPGAAAESVPDKASNPSMQDVLAALESSGLSLPEDTTPLNLAERIIVASKALAGKKAQEQEEEGLAGQPGDTKQQPLPIAMAGEVMAVNKKVSDDGLTITFDSKEDRQQYEQQSEKSLEFSAEFVRNDYQRRVEALVHSGRVTPAYVNARLRPLMEGFELSLDSTGQKAPTQLDTVLDALEDLPENATGMGTGQKAPARFSPRKPLAGMEMSFEEKMPAGYEGGGEITPERTAEVVEEQLAAAGQ